MKKFCDRCGVKLTEENNKQGFNICDKCNEELERECAKDKNNGTRNDFIE